MAVVVVAVVVVVVAMVVEVYSDCSVESTVVEESQEGAVVSMVAAPEWVEG